jgi:WD40 repeat protein
MPFAATDNSSSSSSSIQDRASESMTAPQHSLASVSLSKFAAATSKQRGGVFGADVKTVKRFEMESVSKLAFSTSYRGHKDTTVSSLRWSPDSNALACGCSDGTIRVFNRKFKLTYMLSAPLTEQLAVTTMSFRPVNDVFNTKNVLLAGSADGSLSHWHVTSRACFYTAYEPDNDVYAVEYHPDGLQYASAGKDATIRVYDEQKKKIALVMRNGKKNVCAGHSSRVYALKYVPFDENLILTAGWDNTVQFWDTRCGLSVRSIYGPHIAGDGIDVSPDGKHILTGAWVKDNALQMWDFGTGKLLHNINYRGAQETPKRAEMIYSVHFSPTGNRFAACGTGYTAKLYDATTMAMTSEIPLSAAASSSSAAHASASSAATPPGAFQVRFSPDSKRVAVAGNTSAVTVADLPSN